MNTAPVNYTIGLGGGHGNYPTRGIPAGWLIGADGKVVWQGSPGSLSDKIIEEELKKIEKPTDEVREQKAEKSIAYAEELIAKARYLQAQDLLEQTAKEHKGTEAAKKAEARAKELDKDEAIAKELKAQKILEKLFGGTEKPKEKFKGKEREKLAVYLETFMKKNEDAPGAVAIAKEWITVMQEDWAREK